MGGANWSRKESWTTLRWEGVGEDGLISSLDVTSTLKDAIFANNQKMQAEVFLCFGFVTWGCSCSHL